VENTEGFETMKSEQLLAAFTPSIMSHETLEAIFVRRESLATRLMDNLRTSATTPSKRHSVLVGPRGIGKTYLVSLLYHRVKEDEELRSRFRIAWLREENWEVASFLDLMESILAALADEYEDKSLRAAKAGLSTLTSENAEAHAERLLLDFLGDRVLLLIAENLDDLFDSIEEMGQRQLRAFLQNHANTVLIATTPSLFHGVSDHDAPFYNFFTITHLDELILDDAVRLLEKIAILREDPKLAAFIRTDTGHDRLEAVQHLAGGHPRIWIFFAGIVTEEALDALVPIFLQMLDDLTPYYQSRMKELPLQQRKIVAYLCTTRGAVPVREIADACRLSHPQTAAQLHDLRKKAFVRSEAIGRESWYELNEPLMRLVFEIKESRGRPIRLIVDFLRRWYSRSERRAKYDAIPMEAHTTRLYVEAALDLRGFSDVEPLVRKASMKWSVPDKLLAAGEFEKALGVIEDAIEYAGRLATAKQWISHGSCLSSLQRYSDALESIDRAIELDPMDSSAYLMRGVTLVQLVRYPELLDSVDHAIRLDPTNAYSHNLRGTVLHYLGRFDEALESIDRAIELVPTDSSFYINRGNGLRSLKRFNEALESIDRSIELAPTDSSSYSNRGNVLRALNRSSEALESFDRAIELDPTDADSHYLRGIMLTGMDRLNDALESLDRTIELAPTNAHSHNLRGAVLIDLGRFNEALESLDQVIKLDPTNVSAHSNRGNALIGMDRLSEALESFDRAIELDPRNVSSHNRRGYAMGILQRYPEALASFDRVIELDSVHIGAYVSRGFVLNALNHYTEALESLDKAIKIDIKHTLAYYNRAKSFLALGRWSDFLADLHQALQAAKTEYDEKWGYSYSYCKLLIEISPPQVLPERITALVRCYAKHEALKWLGQGLTESLSDLFRIVRTYEVTDAWNEAWQVAGAGHADLEIPLRLLDATVQWLRKPDRRILLRLPAEERHVLEKILPPQG
jgi:tetratricopeptide (TPR) repeat protein